MRGLLRITELKTITIIPATTFRFRQCFCLLHVKLKGRYDTELRHLVSMSYKLLCSPTILQANHDLTTIIRFDNSDTVCGRELLHNAAISFGQ